MPELPRPQYPRPQFRRDDWLCLNGQWQFEIDAGDSGLERGLVSRALSREITVPFCPESKLSGVNHLDFMPAVWYRREVEIPKNWTGRRTLLHFGAVDYDATVWVNGIELARHRGGFTPFSIDITDAVRDGSATIVLRARDDYRGRQPRGKQSVRYDNYECLYHRTTGIWQTVWLEPVPSSYLQRPRITPNVAGGLFTVECPLVGPRRKYFLRITISEAAEVIASATVAADQDFTPKVDVVLPAEHRRLWSIDDPFLYDVRIELLDAAGTLVDSLDSYAGLRGISIEGMAVLINGKPVFQRLVLDQGYYPDGLMTAPSDQALIDDITLSQAAGFNGARLHQKVFEERFLYHADRLGYLCWGEFPDWGSGEGGNTGDHQWPTTTFVTEWLEAVARDYSHPSIIGWCPLNETRQNYADRITMLDDGTRGMFLATKAADGTRPVLDVSGYAHRVPETDIWDSHDYQQDVEKFRANHAGLADGNPFANPEVDHTGRKPPRWSTPWAGQPYWVSEFGGIWWNREDTPEEFSWGYGARPQSLEEFFVRFEGLVSVLLENPNMFGYCYTQLTDVFQEQNGIYHFDRRPKFDLARIKAAQSRMAAIEQSR